MQTVELREIKDKIISVTGKFAAQAVGWEQLATIKKDTVLLIETLASILKIDPKVGASGREPQSEQEDQDKKLDFQKEITREARKFMMDIQSLIVVNQQDLKDLKEMLENQNK